MLAHATGWLLTGLAFCGAGFGFAVAIFILRFDHDAPRKAIARAVTILKPLHFVEPGLKQAIVSVLRQNYAAPLQLILGVQDQRDPAIAVVREVMNENPDADIKLVIDATPHGSNRKVSNLINMAEFAKYDLLVLSDSDIAVEPDWLSTVAAHFERDGVGAVSCLYAGKARGNFWSVMSAMGSSYEFLPNVIGALSLGLASPCFGSTIALTRATLSRIGGFRAFANQLADDYEIGRAVRGLGLEVVIPAFVVDHTSAEESWTEYFRHERRWNRTTRLIDPIGHTGSIITHAFPLALLAAPFEHWAAFSLALVAATLASRLSVKWCIERKFRTRAGPVWALPLRDLLAFFVFLSSFFGENVHWRGSRFAVSPGGALSQS
jgi:ceramide glucosyltransferase